MGSFISDEEKGNCIYATGIKFMDSLLDLLTENLKISDDLLANMAKQAIVANLLDLNFESRIEEMDKLIDCLRNGDKQQWAMVLHLSGKFTWSDKKKAMFFDLFKQISPFKENSVLLFRKVPSAIMIDNGDLHKLLWNILKEKHSFDGRSTGFVAILPPITDKEVETFDV